MKTLSKIFSLLLIMLGTQFPGSIVQISNAKISADDQKEQESMCGSSEVQVHGEYMKAFLVAYKAFEEDTDIPSQKRHIENYILRFSQDKDNYFVVFVAKRKPKEHALAGGESELGKDVRYTVRKSDYRVASRLF